jgi:hypothetical protein
VKKKRKEFGVFFSGEVRRNGERRGKREPYESVKKNTASLSDNMKKIGKNNKQGYQIKRKGRLM